MNILAGIYFILCVCEILMRFYNTTDDGNEKSDRNVPFAQILLIRCIFPLLFLRFYLFSCHCYCCCLLLKMAFALPTHMSFHLWSFYIVSFFCFVLPFFFLLIEVMQIFFLCCCCCYFILS